MKLPLALASALLLASTAALAVPPANDPPPPTAGSELAAPPAAPGAARHHDGEHGRGGWGQHGPRRHGPPILRQLHGLNLSQAQRGSIHQVMEKNHDARRALMERRFKLMRGFATLDPTTPAYTKQSEQLADESARLSRETVRFEAGLTRQIVALLTPDQVHALQLRISERRQHWQDKHERL